MTFPKYKTLPLTIRHVYSGPRYPQGSNMLILASDLRWYLRSVSGHVEGPLPRQGAAYWLRTWRHIIREDAGYTR